MFFVSVCLCVCRDWGMFERRNVCVCVCVSGETMGSVSMCVCVYEELYVLMFRMN